MKLDYLKIVLKFFMSLFYFFIIQKILVSVIKPTYIDLTYLIVLPLYKWDKKGLMFLDKDLNFWIFNHYSTQYAFLDVNFLFHKSLNVVCF